MTATLITGQEPRVREKHLDLAVASEALSFSDAGIRHQYGIPEAAVQTIVRKDEGQMFTDLRYQWFEVTIA